MIEQQSTTTPLNQAESSTLIAQSTSTTVGKWQVLPYQCPTLPCHAALLRTGNVFFFAGSSNNPTRLGSPGNSVVWNVNSGTFSSQPAPTDASGLPVDIFCAGHSFRSDGGLMIAGGTLKYDTEGNFKGATAAFLFDPSNQQLRRVAPMNRGRWYPTLVTLGNGRIFALSGLDINGNLSRNPEIFSSSTGWRVFSQQTSAFDLYAHIYLLSTGQLFYAGAYFSSYKGLSPRLLNLPGNFSQAITETPVGALQIAESAAQAASVLLPPAQDQKVMVIGGGNPNLATKRVSIIDLKQSKPAYTAVASLNFARKHHNAVLLPDRTVFVCNGSAESENGSKAALAAEIYDPLKNTWTVAATASVIRLYHSVALLLPDGRVVAAGGNPKRLNECGSSGNVPGSNPVLPCEEKRLEIYSPPYISQTRPVISSAPSSVGYGRTITIGTPQAASIQWVSLIKPMSTTHGLDTEQRLVDLPITSRNNTSLTVSITNNPNLAPTGWYMLFISNTSRVPSVARWMRLS